MLTGRVANVGKKAIGGVTNAAKNLASKLPGVAQKAKGALISARQSIGAQAQILRTQAGAVYRGVANNVRATSQRAWNNATFAKNQATAAYHGVSSTLRSGAQSAVNRAKTGTSNFLRENWSVMWKTSVANSQVEGVGNVGWAYATDDRSQPDSKFTFREALGAYSGGAVAGGLGGLGPLAKVIPEGWGAISKLAPYAISVGGGEAGLYAESGITGKDVTFTDHVWTMGGSALMTHFPGPKVDDPELSPSRQHLSPSMTEYAGYSYGAKMASTNIDGAKFIVEETTGQEDSEVNDEDAEAAKKKIQLNGPESEKNGILVSRIMLASAILSSILAVVGIIVIPFGTVLENVGRRNANIGTYAFIMLPTVAFIFYNQVRKGAIENRTKTDEATTSIAMLNTGAVITCLIASAFIFGQFVFLRSFAEAAGLRWFIL